MSLRTCTGNALRRRRVIRPIGLGLGALATAALVTAAPVSATAQPRTQASAAAGPCGILVAGVDNSGDKITRSLKAQTPVTESSRPAVPWVPTPRAMSNVELDIQYDPDETRWEGESSFAVVDGVLHHYAVGTVYRGAGEVVERKVSDTKYSSGWGGFKTLVFSDTTQFPTSSGSTRFLYGHHDNGAIYRYSLTRQSTGNYTIRSAGSVAGFGAVKGLALVSQQANADVLLANTTAGTLITIRSPFTTAMSTTVTRVRNSSWQGFSHLAVDKCSSGSILAGLHPATGKVYVYTLPFITGTTTPITGWGASPTAFPVAPFTAELLLGGGRLSGA